jgi:hypothetical protein
VKLIFKRVGREVELSRGIMNRMGATRIMINKKT